MATTPTPSGTPDSCDTAVDADSSKSTWGGFLYRNWKWIAGLMVLGFIIDRFDGKDATLPDRSSKPEASEQSAARNLPKVQRAAWGPKTLSEAKRFALVDDPEACKGKEYKMEVKYRGGGSRDSNGRLEDIECDVWTGGSFFQMEFSFPPDVKQPNIKPGDYLNISFVFSGATKSFFNNPNVVTAVERPDH